jgi:hypothetical protein
MDPTSLIPHYQALPFPAPVWLLQILLVLGFYLHAIPMNVVLGGGLTSAICLLSGRHNKESNCFRFGKSLAAALPLFISFAITQGIVPLLFVQLLYGPMFYTSSILMATPWISIIFLLLVAYYSSYIVIYRFLKNPERSQGIGAPLLIFFASIIFMLIAYLFTANMTLMLTPDKWLQMYQHNQFGMNMPKDPQILPRLMHSFIASLAVAGLTMGCFGLVAKKKDSQYGSWLIRKGSMLFALFTSIQIPVGIWFLKSLPQEIMLRFLGGDPLGTAAFATSMVLALIALVCTGISSSTASPGAFKAGLCAALGTILAMVVTRHELRNFYLEKLIAPDKVPVNTQWDLLTVFILSAVALGVYITWLIKLVWKGADNAAALSASSPGLESAGARD